MAGITELKALVADNHEATEILGQIENTIMQSTGRIADLERNITEGDNKLNEAIGSRDKVRQTIKDELGISEFTPEAVRAKLSTYASDDVLEARDAQFNNLRATSAQKIEGLEGKLTTKDKEMQGLMLKLAISKTDIMGQTKGEHATDMLLQWIAEDAVFLEDGSIAYKGKSGETLYNSNGNPMTLDDRISEIKADEGRDFIFQSRFLQGGGAPTEKVVTGPAGNSATGGKLTRATMAFEEKQDYRKKYGEQAYMKLPLV
tara:strand:- start:16870 stop:17649 length:780 start_codon:yes stop_codon:yes gene_type:complete